MDKNWDKCIDFVLVQEGGFSDRIGDSGGATNHGITRATLSAYLGRPASFDDVKKLTIPTVKDIYRRNYWTPEMAGLRSGLDLFMFDWGVNAGPRRVLKIAWNTLQSSEPNPYKVLDRLVVLRNTFYAARSAYHLFGRGWDARTRRAATAATVMIHEDTGLVS